MRVSIDGARRRRRGQPEGLLAHWEGRRLFAAPRHRTGRGAARYVRNASRDERWRPVVRARGSFLHRKAVRDCDQSLCAGRRWGGPVTNQGASEPCRTPTDRSDRWADAFRVETRTLPKQKASHSAVQKGCPATRRARQPCPCSMRKR